MSQLQAATEAEIKFVARMAVELARAAKSLQFVDVSPNVLDFAITHANLAQAAMQTALNGLVGEGDLPLIKSRLAEARKHALLIQNDVDMNKAMAEKAGRFAGRLWTLIQKVMREEQRMESISRGEHTPGVLSSGALKYDINEAPDALVNGMNDARQGFQLAMKARSKIRPLMKKIAQLNIEEQLASRLIAGLEKADRVLGRLIVPPSQIPMNEILRNPRTSAMNAQGMAHSAGKNQSTVAEARDAVSFALTSSYDVASLRSDLSMAEIDYENAARHFNIAAKLLAVQLGEDAPGVLSTDEFKANDSSVASMALIAEAKTVANQLGQIAQSAQSKKTFIKWEPFLRALDKFSATLRSARGALLGARSGMSLSGLIAIIGETSNLVDKAQKDLFWDERSGHSYAAPEENKILLDFGQMQFDSLRTLKKRARAANLLPNPDAPGVLHVTNIRAKVGQAVSRKLAKEG